MGEVLYSSKTYFSVSTVYLPVRHQPYRNRQGILLLQNYKKYIQKSCSALEDKDNFPLSNSSTDIWNISEYGDSKRDCFDTNGTDTSYCEYSESMSYLI